MSDERRPIGPAMLVLTDALKSPKVRIGHIGGNFTLPRTVPLAALVAGLSGALLGLALGFFIIGGLQGTLYSSVLLGAAGVFVVTWSPLKGESMGMWLGLQANSRRKKLTLNGEPVQLAVGIAVLGEVITGKVRIASGAVTIPPSQYDERGVPINAEDIFHRLLSLRGIPAVAGVYEPSGESIHEARVGRGGEVALAALATHRQLVESTLGTSTLAKAPRRHHRDGAPAELPAGGATSELHNSAPQVYEYPDYDLADDTDPYAGEAPITSFGGTKKVGGAETVSDWVQAPETSTQAQGGWTRPKD